MEPVDKQTGFEVTSIQVRRIVSEDCVTNVTVLKKQTRAWPELFLIRYQ